MKIYYSLSIPSLIESALILLPDHYGRTYGHLWDDFGYKTSFRAFIKSGEDTYDLGFVKILFNGHMNSHEYITNNFDEIRTNTYELQDFSKENVVSLGTDIDYYKRLAKHFEDDPEQASNFLSSIADASYLHSQIEEFNDWPGFTDSLLRDSSSSANLKKGFAVATSSYSPLTNFSFTAETPCDEDIDFKFSTQEKLSGNINIVIGKNGFGKTKTLHNIADTFTGLNKSGTKWPYFNKLIVVSFSPFESFHTQKELNKRLSKKNSKRTKFINEYSYVGIKSDSKTNPLNLDALSRRSVIAYLDALIYDKNNDWWWDDDKESKEDLIFRSLNQAMTFENIVVKHKDGSNISTQDIKNHLKTKNKNEIKDLINADKGLIFLDEKGNEKPLSSGQKIYSLFTPSIISEIKEESLILIDEPELYLHPELEVGLMSMLKTILKETKSFCIIATHSSIIAREVKRDYVRIFKKNNTITKPEIETFGNSLDEITGYVFDDYNTSKPYEELVKGLLKNYATVDEAIDHLSSEIGDSALTYLYQLKREGKNND